MVHTLLFLKTPVPNGLKSYTEFFTVGACIQNVCDKYEAFLLENSFAGHVRSFDISSFCNYVDIRVADIAALVYNPDTRTYVPRNKNWLKQEGYAYLREKLRIERQKAAKKS